MHETAVASSRTMTEKKTPFLPTGHLPALDGIRGLAVLAVMVYHFFGFGGMARTHIVDDLAYMVVMLGWSGVELFFVLSGFLITGILVDTRGKPNYFQTFYARRSLRIFPLYIFALVAVFFLLQPLFPDYADLHSNGSHQTWFWLYLSNILTAVSGWDAVPRALQHFWSLAIEEQFYLVWPLLVFYLSRRSMLRVCGLIVLGSLMLRIWLHANGQDLAAYVLTPARMDALAIGAALALAAREPALLRVLMRWVKPVTSVVAVVLVGIIVWRVGLIQFDPVVGTIGYTLLGIGFAGLLLLAITSDSTSIIHTVFHSQPLRFLGKYSYALYIFHQPIALVLPALGISAAIIPPVAGLTLPGQLLFTAIAGGLSLAAALLSWNLFEKHFLALKGRFSNEERVPALERLETPVTRPGLVGS